MTDFEFEKQFEQKECDPSPAIVRTLMALHDSWPDVLATFTHMVNLAMEEGWTETAARALVLSSVTDGNIAIFANLEISDTDDDEDDETDDTP